SAQRPDANLGMDVILWRHKEDEYKDHFPIVRTWEQIRARGQELPWYQLLWYLQGVPRHAFIVWLAFKDRLAREVTNSLVRYVEKKKRAEITCFLLVLTLYYLLTSWDPLRHRTGITRERNSRRHQGPWLTTEIMIRHTDKSIRNRISSLKNHILAGLLRRWLELYTR
ncbi:LOW QUALITY PROTEIN: hypothetical protein HID58_014823, partial [Brassica napus]